MELLGHPDEAYRLSVALEDPQLSQVRQAVGDHWW